jgi:hypothetical protein
MAKQGCTNPMLLSHFANYSARTVKSEDTDRLTSVRTEWETVSDWLSDWLSDWISNWLVGWLPNTGENVT